MLTPTEGYRDEASPLLGDQISPTGGDGAHDVERHDEASSSNAKNGKAPIKVNMRVLIPAVGIGLFLMAIDQLLTVASYAKIGSELKALNSTGWIATSYFLTLTSFQPLYGKLSDIFGRKECLLFAYAVFGIGCLGCGLSQDIVQLCVARAISGIGGGGMNSVVVILLSDLVPLRERAVWQGYINIIGCLGTSLGAPLGGLLADSVGWRWAFIGQVPLCGVAFVAVYFVLNLPPVSDSKWLDKFRQIDFLGAFVLILAVVALLVGLDCGSNLGWSHKITIVSLALTPVIFAAFVYIEMKVAIYPFAPGHVIFDRGLFPCYLINFFASGTYTAVLFFVPLYFQAVMGVSATTSGIWLMPAMVSVVCASLAGGWVIKATGRFYWITAFGCALALVAHIPLMLSVRFGSTVGEVIGLALLTSGTSTCVTTILVGVINNAASEDMALSIACSYLFRSLGSSVGVSVSYATLQQILKTQLAARFPDGDEARRIEERVRLSLEYIKRLSPWQADQVRESYQVATLGAYWPSVIISVAGLLSSLWVKETVLRK